MTTINMTLRIINGFTLDENFNTTHLEDDRYSFTMIDGETPTQDEIIGDKSAILAVLKGLVARLEDPNYQEVKFENTYLDAEQGLIKLPY